MCDRIKKTAGCTWSSPVHHHPDEFCKRGEKETDVRVMVEILAETPSNCSMWHPALVRLGGRRCIWRQIPYILLIHRKKKDLGGYERKR